MLDFLCDDCKAAFEELKANLDALGIPYEVDPGIVRGLDYYTKTAFEFVSDKLGAQSTVCGGGRYDNLVSEVGGPATPGVGFGLGIERLLLVLEACGVEIPKESDTDVFVAALGSAAQLKGLELVKAIRKEGIRADIDLMGRGLKAQMKNADRLGASYVLVLGDDELAKGVVQLRNMKASEQKEVPFAEIINEIK